MTWTNLSAISLIEFFKLWKEFNVIPSGGERTEDDDASEEDDDDLVQYKLKQKVACANSIVRRERLRYSSTRARRVSPRQMLPRGYPQKSR